MKRAALFLTLFLMAGMAQAAGNHHAVDDAAILDAGQCELEGWLSRPRGGGSLVHTGVGCRVGPVELGAAGEYERSPGGSQTGWGLQVKWATALTPDISVGVAVSPGWQAHVRPRHQGATVAGLLTWKAHDALAVHLNIGRDLVRSGPDLNRSGVAVEWMVRPGITLVGERYAEEASQFLRGGLRWAVRDELSIDFSRAQRLSGAGVSTWTVGATWLFGS